MKKIIIREYIESLKEDEELDYIFPLLLEVLNFKIITTPKDSKGVSQYGKDVIAIGEDPLDNKTKVFYFEIKGGQDKNVTPSTFAKEDGIRESLIEAKDVIYKDESIPELKKYPTKIILVHNGTLKATVKDTFNGFIEREFANKQEISLIRFFRKREKQKIEFERWGIYKLTELFELNLFNEYLLTEKESLSLFKKMLVLHGVPENNQQHFYNLVNHLFKNPPSFDTASRYISRSTLMFFETLRLIGFMSYTISKESENLLISLKCNSYLICRIWSWMLKHNLESEIRILKLFKKIKDLHYSILLNYFDKTLPVAKIKNGLYFDNGGRYEIFGHPMRCFEYLSYFNHLHEASKNEKVIYSNKTQYVSLIKEIISNNDGTKRPLLDIHSVSIIKTILNLIDYGEIEFARNYTLEIIENVIKQKAMLNILPDARNNLESIIKIFIKGERSIYYEDNVSYLIAQLAELCSLLDLKLGYDKIVENFNSIILATFVPYNKIQADQYLDEQTESIEQLFFKRGLYSEGYQSEIKLENTLAEFSIKTGSKNEGEIVFKTSETDFADLIYLAHHIFYTPLFPKYWRTKINKQST